LRFSINREQTEELGKILKGQSINDEDKAEIINYAFFYAAQRGNVNMAKYLKEEMGADVNAGIDEGMGTSYPIIIAANNSRKEMIDWLIENNADVNKKDARGGTALMWAGAKVSRFIQRGDDNHEDKKNVSIAESLIRAGTNLDLKDKRDKTALDYLKKEGENGKNEYKDSAKYNTAEEIAKNWQDLATQAARQGEETTKTEVSNEEVPTSNLETDKVAQATQSPLQASNVKSKEEDNKSLKNEKVAAVAKTAKSAGLLNWVGKKLFPDVSAASSAEKSGISDMISNNHSAQQQPPFTPKVPTLKFTNKEGRSQ